MLKTLKILSHILMVTALTVLTQIGGLIWICVFGFFKAIENAPSRRFQFSVFTILYLSTSLIFIPLIAPLTGRVPLPWRDNSGVRPHSYATVLLNRHYVKPALRDNLISVARELKEQNTYLLLSYLDANFPFLDGFPLLPHLSHDDGKKVDLAFYYTKDKETSNLKPSRTGYGIFEQSDTKEYNQVDVCLRAGYWQYDYPKYLTLGSRADLVFDEITTKQLMLSLLSKQGAQKLFIEPHLKQRLELEDSKIRFQGCRSVRHDDHIHYQIR